MAQTKLIYATEREHELLEKIYIKVNTKNKVDIVHEALNLFIKKHKIEVK